MAIIAIDCDLTVVDTGKEWWKWCAEQVGNKTKVLPTDIELSYNFKDYFKEIEDPYEFWRKEDLYDNLEPYEDAKRVINALCKRHEVVFVSTIKGNHHKSKYNFLKKHFPEMSGFVATKEKQYVPSDVFIDDRNDVLNKVRSTHRIKLETPYTQAEELTGIVSHCADWRHIGNVLNWFGY